MPASFAHVEASIAASSGRQRIVRSAAAVASLRRFSSRRSS